MHTLKDDDQNNETLCWNEQNSLWQNKKSQNKDFHLGYIRAHQTSVVSQGCHQTGIRLCNDDCITDLASLGTVAVESLTFTWGAVLEPPTRFLGWQTHTSTVLLGYCTQVWFLFGFQVTINGNVEILRYAPPRTFRFRTIQPPDFQYVGYTTYRHTREHSNTREYHTPYVTAPRVQNTYECSCGGLESWELTCN